MRPDITVSNVNSGTAVDQRATLGHAIPFDGGTTKPSTQLESKETNHSPITGSDHIA